MRIILGSQSKGRREVMDSMGLEFETMSPDIDERVIRSDDPRALTLALAHAKADALLPQIQGPAILITSDQVVSWNGQIFEKPVDAAQVRTFIQGYAQYPAETPVSVVVVNTATGKRAEGTDVPRVHFHPIPDTVVEEIIRAGRCFAHAGAFDIADPLFIPYIKRVEGAQDSVIGLPIDLTRRLMAEVTGAEPSPARSHPPQAFQPD